jgi:hypothetical protein
VSDTLSGLSEAEAATTEFQNAVGQLREYAATNREGVEVTIENERAVQIGIGDGLTRAGWLAEGIFHRGEQEDATLLYLFCWDGLFLKARISYDLGQEAAVRPHLEAWLRENLQSIKRVG